MIRRKHIFSQNFKQAAFMLIDFHTHSKREKNDIIEVVSIHPQRKQPSDWYTIGFHPWWTDQLLTDKELDDLRTKLEQDVFCLGLGECGLDKLKGTDLKQQERIFTQQIELANEIHAPLIVHCVRVYDTVLKLHQRLAKTPWVVHGYLRHAILAKSIIDQGIYLSVAPSKKMAVSFEATLKYLPLDRFFIETDSDTSLNIKERYARFSDIRGIDINTLENQLFNNFKTFFQWKYLG
jgi:TatD DNase family protein